MKLLIKLLTSIPIILITLFFIPFLGICLIIARLFLIKNRTKILPAIIFLILGIIINLPLLIENIIKKFHLEINVPYLREILGSDFYTNDLILFGKRLIIIGVIYILLVAIFNKLIDIIQRKIIEYFQKEEEKDIEIRKENDLKMQEKRERSKNTHVVRCPYCGSDNTLTSKVGKCAFCRKSIEYKE